MVVTIKEIAKRLGTSPSTVSMALSNHPGISDATKVKVSDTAKEMGYTRHLKRAPAEPRYIQLIIYKKHGSVVSDTPFFSSLIQGIESQTKKREHNLLVTYFYESQDTQEQLRLLSASNSKGIILLATEMFSENLSVFDSLGIPIVVLDSYFPKSTLDCIGINNVQGAAAAVDHLLTQGHTELGYLSSSTPIRNFLERQEGYLEGLRDSQASEASQSRVVKVSPTADGAIRDMRLYLQSKPKLATAYFADNDIIASSCIRALKELGYRVPDDVSIIGFDDTPICEMIEPPLTTLCVPKENMGCLAVDRLLDRVDGINHSTVRIQVMAEIVARKSVRRI